MHPRPGVAADRSLYKREKTQFVLTTAQYPAQQADVGKRAVQRDRVTAMLCTIARMPDPIRTLNKRLLHKLTRHELVDPIDDIHHFKSHSDPATHNNVVFKHLPAFCMHSFSDCADLTHLQGVRSSLMYRASIAFHRPSSLSNRVICSANGYTGSILCRSRLAHLCEGKAR